MLRIILTIALACCAPVYGAPIPPGPVGSFVNNSAAPQNAQFNVSSGTVRGKLTAGELAVTTLSVTGVIDGSFEGSGAGLTGIPWAGVIKTGSNLNEITTRDHSVLTSTGTNSHAAIDSHVLSSAAVHGSTASNLGSRIVQRDASGNFAAGAVTATSFVGPVFGNATTATMAANISGGSLGTIPYQTASGATAMLPVGPFNYVLQGKGAATPTWTSSPTITGANITAIPLSALSAGTLPVSIPASSITVTGTQVGTFGGPTQSAQITVGSDGRVRSIVQYSIPAVSTNAVLNTESYTWDKYQNFLSSISVGSIYGDGTNLTGVNDVVARAGVAALDVATTTLTQDLATEISDRQIADAAIGITTGTLRTDLSAETLARGLADAAIGVTTGTLRADLTTETNNRITGDYNLGVDTTTLFNTKVAKAGDTMTGGLTLLTSSITVHNATSGTAYGAFRFYDDSPNNPVVTMGMNSVGTKTELVTCAGGSNCGPGMGGYSWAADGNIMGFNTSGVLSAPSFSGPLTGLASLNLPLTGGTLTGPLTLSGSSLTVTGSASSSFVGSLGIGTPAPIVRFGFAAPWVSIKSDAPGLILDDTGSTTRTRFFSNNAGLLEIGQMSNNGSASVTHIVVSHTTGFVGIGTTTPATKLHVQDGVVLSSTTSGFGAFTGYGSSGGCLMFRDTDNAGWTECKFLDGVMSCATDADGVCD